MKVFIENYASSFGVALMTEDGKEYYAPTYFSNINDALAFCEDEIDNRLQAVSGVVFNADTGELYATCHADNYDGDGIEDYTDCTEYEECWPEDFPDDVDETFYDPYAGCDMYETCDFDGGW